MGVASKLPLITTLLLSVGCEASDSGPKLQFRPVSTAPDRLQAGELLPNKQQIFGIEVPRGLRVASRFTDVVQLTGHLKPETVANYFRQHVLAQHVEIGPNRTVFPRVYVKNDPKKRIYRIEIVAHRNLTTVNMRDITPPPVTQGLTNEERWERAGRNPDGTLKNRLQVQ